MQAPGTLAQGGSLFTHDGSAVGDSLCESVTTTGNGTHTVLAGRLCKGFEEFVQPEVPAEYQDTKDGCAYSNQLVRPFLLSAPMPPACARVMSPPLPFSKQIDGPA